MQRRRVVYTGRVQGVGFRATVSSIARGFDVSGWVRNEPGGEVTLEAQGEAAEIERFLGAVGDRMEGFIRGRAVDQLDAVPDEQGFRVRH